MRKGWVSKKLRKYWRKQTVVVGSGVIASEMDGRKGRVRE